MKRADAVFFIGFGGPEKREDIMPFLETVTRGRGIPKERLEEVAHHYEALGGKSPINEITRRQAKALEDQLRAHGSGLKVYIGQRNWHPFLKEGLQKMSADKVKRAIGFITAAHRCEASHERYIRAVEEAQRQVPGTPVIDYVKPWFDHPLFIEAIADRIKEAAPPPDAVWIFTAHSVPVPMAEASKYVQELERTAGLAAAKFRKTTWRLAYTSRSGKPSDPWLEPDVSDVIQEEARKGSKSIFLIPIGFIADHVEVLYDLDVEARQTANQLEVPMIRAATVGDHPAFARMMSEVILAE